MTRVMVPLNEVWANDRSTAVRLLVVALRSIGWIALLRDHSPERDDLAVNGLGVSEYSLKAAVVNAFNTIGQDIVIDEWTEWADHILTYVYSWPSTPANGGVSRPEVE